MSKRKGRPPRTPIMPSFRARHYGELRLFIGSLYQQFTDAVDSSLQQIEIADLPQFREQLSYNRHALSVLRDIQHQIDLDQRRHSKPPEGPRNVSSAADSGGVE